MVSHHLRTHCAERCISTCLLPAFGTSKTASMSRLRLCIKSRSAILQRKRERKREICICQKNLSSFMCCFCRCCSIRCLFSFVSFFLSLVYVRAFVCVCRLHANIRSVLENSDSQHRAYGVCVRHSYTNFTDDSCSFALYA